LSKCAGSVALMVDAGGGLTTMGATTVTRTPLDHTIGAIGTGVATIGDDLGGANNSAPLTRAAARFKFLIASSGRHASKCPLLAHSGHTALTGACCLR
jgi:hypothetical protein